MEKKYGNTCLFLGDLSFVCDENDVRQGFERFGLIVSVRIKRGKSKKNLSYGFIEFTTVQEAIDAMLTMDGTEFFGRQLM